MPSCREDRPDSAGPKRAGGWNLLLMFVCLAGLVVPIRAAEGSAPKKFYQMSDREIEKTLKDIHARAHSLGDRVAEVSEHFLGTPYKLGPLGEGPTGEFDRGPLVNFKGVDCTTLVEQVMALSLEPDLDQAVASLQKIRYKNGEVDYESRNHFPEIDWIPNNIAAGYIADITQEIGGDKVRWATKRIKKRKWFEDKKMDALHGFDKDSVLEHENRLKKLHKAGARFKDQTAKIPYIPVDALPDALGRIPYGAIANLVREDQPDKPTLISHQVLIIEKNGAKYVRHAAAGKSVEDVPALEYFHRYDGSKWKLIGANVDAILAP